MRRQAGREAERDDFRPAHEDAEHVTDAEAGPDEEGQCATQDVAGVDQVQSTREAAKEADDRVAGQVHGEGQRDTMAIEAHGHVGLEDGVRYIRCW